MIITTLDIWVKVFRLSKSNDITECDWAEYEYDTREDWVGCYDSGKSNCSLFSTWLPRTLSCQVITDRLM